MSTRTFSSTNWAFIFDLDGVVVDSMPAHTEAWRVYLERHGIVPVDIEGKMHGRRNDEIVAHYFGSGLAAPDVFNHGAAKEELFRQLIGSNVIRHLVPGIGDFLARHESVATGLASNAEPANIDFVLDTAGLRRHFDVIVDGHQVNRPKPHPDIYLRAAEILGFPPGKCIVFEDSPAGIQAALGAGTRVIAVQTHTSDLPSVDFSIRDFSDPVLDSWLASLEPQP